MRFGGRRTSSNVESQSGGGFGGLGGGLGGAGRGMLFSLVFSRFGIGGVIVLFLVLMLFGGNPLGLTGEKSGAPGGTRTEAGSAAQACAADPTRQFLCQVLASTEDQWGQIFTAAGRTYPPPVLVYYPGSGMSGCGAAQSAMGPFYCPADRKIYIDTSFFDELARRFGAPGDFAQAYVVAHEVGHHVQAVTGTADAIRRAQSGASRAEGNALQVRMELQADCFAGVWAARERDSAMEPGDLEEGMGAAAAIGDDTLQRAGQGRVVPESFTHGTSAQRQEALTRGFNSGGDPRACDAYTAGI